MMMIIIIVIAKDEPSQAPIQSRIGIQISNIFADDAEGIGGPATPLGTGMDRTTELGGVDDGAYNVGNIVEEVEGFFGLAHRILLLLLVIMVIMNIIIIWMQMAGRR